MKHLLQHFNNLTLHPKNATALKGLILQLAVQGKLTENWRAEHPDVESGDELLKRISKENNNSSNKKKIIKSSVDISEMNFELPVNWTWCRLGELGQAQTGTTPPKKNPSFYGDYIPFLGPANISNQFMCYPKKGLTEKGLEAGRLIPKNSLMMVCIGGSIGKCNINQIEVSCNQQINAITPIINHPVMIKIICQSPYFQKILINKSSGSATPIINKGKWEKITTPLPPLQEQKAIVAIVEELFAEVEQLEQKTQERIQLKKDYVTSALHKLSQTTDVAKTWQDLQTHFTTFFNEKANIKSLRESILQLAIQGKLTKNWREQNPNTKSVYKSIQKAFKNQNNINSGRKKFLKNVDRVTFDDKNLPTNWVKSQFFNLCVLKRGHDLPKQERVPGDYAIASSGGLSGWHNEYKTERGVVIGRSGSTGKPHLIDGKHWPLNTVLYGEDYCGNNIDYVFVFLRAFNFSKYTSSTAVPTLNRNKFLNELILIPPLEEQKAIVQLVDELMAYCDGLERKVEQRDNLLEDLMGSCLMEMENTDSEDDMGELGMVAEDSEKLKNK